MLSIIMARRRRSVTTKTLFALALVVGLLHNFSLLRTFSLPIVKEDLENISNQQTLLLKELHGLHLALEIVLGTPISPHQECEAFLQKPTSHRGGRLTWYTYSSSSSSSLRHGKTLVAQYAGLTGDYPEMLNITSRPNHAYARSMGYDFVTLQGILEGCLPWHSAFNKVGLLQEAARRGYDTCLLLDADALVVDMSIPLETIQPDNSTLLTAQWVGGKSRWNINNGVMVWNLRHKMSNAILDDWHSRALQRLLKSALGILKLASDQAALHQALSSTLSDSQQKAYIQNSSSSLFYYEHGTFVKHFTRETLSDGKKNDFSVAWDAHETTLGRLQVLTEAASRVCDTGSINPCDGL